MKNFLASWKTSLAGLLGSVLVGLSHLPQLQNGSGMDWLKALGTVSIPLVIGLFSVDPDKAA